jgi:oxygen-independent coproporphyrinogen-3 oxidase
MLSIYVHIPFCLKKCAYCNFNSYALTAFAQMPDLERNYTEAVINEFKIKTDFFNLQNETVATIYFGGGTPSIFSAVSLEQIIFAIKKKLHCVSDVEITLEVNPATINNVSHAVEFKRAGVNRISLGVQSFLDDKLKFLGRIHSVQDAKTAFELLRAADFSNINLDLIFGCINEENKNLQYELRELLALNPEHVSIYGLSIESGSLFCTQTQTEDKTFTCSETTYAKLYRAIQSGLAKAYHQYEISNFAKSNFESKHNLAYWNGGNYLGLGAGAHSYLFTANSNAAKRMANVASPQKYITQFLSNSEVSFAEPSFHLDYAFEEILTLEQRQIEFIFLNLRKVSGLNLQKYGELFGEKSLAGLRQKTIPLINKNYLVCNNNHLQIPPRQFVIADSIIEQLI